jgi:hypothetical protein
VTFWEFLDRMVSDREVRGCLFIVFVVVAFFGFIIMMSLLPTPPH